MRQLLNAGYASRSVIAGTVLTLSCLPYVFAHGERAGWLLGGTLWAVVIVMWQVCLAWTPREIRNRQPWRTKWFRWLVAVVIGLGVVHLLAIDPVLAKRLPAYFPRSRVEVAIALPWVAVFQVLALVATPFAFAYRLTGKVTVGLALIVLFSQIMVVDQASGQPAELVAALTLLVALRALMLGLAYVYTGFGGAVVVSGLFWARFFFHLVETGS